MINVRWHVRFTLDELPSPVAPSPFVAELAVVWEQWLRFEGVVAGTPYLLSPSFEYDVVLNGFFRSREMVGSARRTQAGYARDLAAFLTFLSSARSGRSWRDARRPITWRISYAGQGVFVGDAHLR